MLVLRPKMTRGSPEIMLWRIPMFIFYGLLVWAPTFLKTPPLLCDPNKPITAPLQTTYKTGAHTSELFKEGKGTYRGPIGNPTAQNIALVWPYIPFIGAPNGLGPPARRARGPPGCGLATVHEEQVCGRLGIQVRPLKTK